MFKTRKNWRFIVFVAAVFLAVGAAVFLWLNFKPAQAQEIGLNYAKNIGLAEPAEKDVRIIAVEILRYLLGFLGIVAVAVIMYAGWLWMISEGDPNKVARAKKILLNGVIGLIIMLSSFAIVSFIVNKIGGGLGGGPGTGHGPRFIPGTGALGACSIESVYPEPEQKNVPRNTIIIITFKERVATSSICQDGGDGICNNDPVAIDGTLGRIRLFYAADQSTCLGGGPCPSEVLPLRISSTDNRTFVISPPSVLGSPSENIKYMVYVSNSITNEAGEGIFTNCATDYFSWEFTVSNQLDLTPPQVESTIPAPDDAADIQTPIAAQQAQGTITVNSQPTAKREAKIVSANTGGGSWSNFNISASSLDANCSGDGAFQVSVNSSNLNEGQLSQGSTLLGTGEINNNTITFNYCHLTLVLASGDFASNCGSANCLWNVTLSSYQTGDTLTVGSITYTFVNGLAGSDEIVLGGNEAGTAANIVAALSVHPEVSGSASGNVVTVIAQVAGEAGNHIALGSTASGLAITPMSGGVDAGVKVTVNGAPDPARNIIIQINFNEAMNPLTLSGAADKVVNFIAVKCLANCGTDTFVCGAGGTDTCLAGKFILSNQYRTVEFQPVNQCGVNTCGEPIYCLPENAHLRVELRAADLADCGVSSCADRTPYNNCVGGHCQNASGQNYPLSALPLGGIADAANNSLDGNRGGSADGPVSFYNENAPSPSDGDSYLWSFFIGSEINITPPTITQTIPNLGDSDISLTDSVVITFDKIMLSSSLRPGATQIFNGREYHRHQLINLRSLAGEGVGYWITKENIDTSSPPDNQPDITRVEIRHTTFSEAMSYRAQVGSGVRDIYQNCFKPSAGPACLGVNDANPSCCNGVITAGEECP